MGGKLILNLFAIFAFFLALGAGLVLLWRRLPRASAALVGECFCASCGTPSSQFSADTFVCPTCGSDVRQQGLIARRLRPWADPFRRVIAFSAVLCLVALVSAVALMRARRESFRVSNDSQRWSDGKTVHRLDLTVSGTWDGGGTFR